jgi:serine protease AprX
VALLLQQRPNLSPDEVKALLVGSARPLNGVAPTTQGAGSVDIGRALATRTPRNARQHAVPATAVLRAVLPQLERLLRHDGDNQDNQDDQNRDVRGAQLIWDHVLWDQLIWDQVLWDQVMWDQLIWDHVLWDQVLWDQVLWDQVMWDQVMWDHVLWDHVLWD